MTLQSKGAILSRLQEIDRLPTLPVIVGQIQRLIANPRSSMDQIAAVISKDPSIASRVVRLVNSSFFGFRSRISSIRQAIVILGLNTVRNLVIGVSVVKAFEDGARASIFDRQAFWLHSFGCALGAKAMAEHLKRKDPEDYFLAGLLHDVGLLVLDQFFHEEFVEALQFSIREKKRHRDAEAELLGVTHGEVGEALSRQWNLPEYLPLAMRHHHAPPPDLPEAPAHWDKIAVIHLAESALKPPVFPPFLEGGEELDSRVLVRVGISETAMEELFAKVSEEIKATLREWEL
jgi:HD-like signal output (HDOD) protein